MADHLRKEKHQSFGDIVAYDVSSVGKRAGNEALFCLHAAQTGKHLLRTQNVAVRNKMQTAATNMSPRGLRMVKKTST